jgi:hypothetical protein
LYQTGCFQEDKVAPSKKSPAQLFAERNKRVEDSIALRTPDRVPVQFFVGYFASKYTGVPSAALYYDAKKWHDANRKTVLDFEPDTYWVQTAGASGDAMELLGPHQIRWPGHQLPENQGHQMVELEPMKQDEYDAYMEDPSDFIVRTYLPRVWDAAAPLAKIAPMRGLVGGSNLVGYLAQFHRPEMAEMLKAFAKAAETQATWQTAGGNFIGEMAALGFPTYNAPGLMAGAPFDTISDNLRGMRGTMLDMYRNQDKLLELCEVLAKQRIEIIRRTQAPKGPDEIRRVFIALHRGSDGFTSLPQFEKFYWPTFKRVLLALIDAGWIPCPFFEGIWDQRLEYIKEIPKGKMLCHFAQTDPKKAKEVLGGHLCVMCDVPPSLLQTASVPEVEDYCKKLIDLFGRDGGYIMTATCLDEAKPENVRAMIEITRTYGRNG